MKVEEFMETDVITVGKNDSITTAVNVMRKEGISHLVVLKEKRVIGVLSEKDILIKLGTERLRTLEPSRLHVSSFMSINPLTISPDDDINKAVRIFLGKNIGILPVVEKGKMVGIITKQDLMELLFEYNRLQVSSIATYNPISVKPTDKYLNARKIITEKMFSALPVIEERNIKGIVTDFRAMEALTSFQDFVEWRHRKERIQTLLVNEIMERIPPVVSSDTTVAEVARKMKNGLKALIVLENNIPAAIVTKTDLLRCLL
ncbi:MAG TPA: CBS domain-containing protein [Thermoproteales archaeon]|nr:CBS domain-containing protein [Thermoproteales archaeon]